MRQTRVRRIKQLKYLILVILAVMLSAMDDNGEGKVTSIRQIVKFKEIFQKWQHVTLGPKGSDDSQSCDVYKGISPKISGKLTSSDIHSDTDEESCQSLEMPSDVPRGYLAVYVGPELRRFVIPTSYLSDPLFKVLLDKVEEEFGFDHRDGLTIPCDIEIFKYLQQCMENHRKERADLSNAGETSLSVNK